MPIATENPTNDRPEIVLRSGLAPALRQRPGNQPVATVAQITVDGWNACATASLTREALAELHRITGELLAPTLANPCLPRETS